MLFLSRLGAPLIHFLILKSISPPLCFLWPLQIWKIVIMAEFAIKKITTGISQLCCVLKCTHRMCIILGALITSQGGSPWRGTGGCQLLLHITLLDWKAVSGREWRKSWVKTLPWTFFTGSWAADSPCSPLPPTTPCAEHRWFLGPWFMGQSMSHGWGHVAGERGSGYGAQHLPLHDRDAGMQILVDPSCRHALGTGPFCVTNGMEVSCGKIVYWEVCYQQIWSKIWI